MVNVRPHDPWSPHQPVNVADNGDVGDSNDPEQPTSPGEQPPAPANSPPVVDTPTDGLDGMLKTELTDLAAAMGLPTSGTKADLIDRVRADRANSPQ